MFIPGQGDTNLRLMEYFKNISSEFRKCCGRKFSSEGKFGEAAAAFLAVDPPAVADAISAAKSSGRIFSSILLNTRLLFEKTKFIASLKSIKL